MNVIIDVKCYRYVIVTWLISIEIERIWYSIVNVTMVIFINQVVEMYTIIGDTIYMCFLGSSTASWFDLSLYVKKRSHILFFVNQSPLRDFDSFIAIHKTYIMPWVKLSCLNNLNKYSTPLQSSFHIWICKLHLF